MEGCEAEGGGVMCMSAGEDAAAKKRIAELEARLRWNPLSEQLPEDSDRLILSLEFGKIPHISWARCVRNNPQIFSHWREIGELPEVGG